jgi:dephospho-CoA kinase
MYCVGLTGGIGCGKSKAADMFGELGADVVDTDAISHALTAPGGAAMQLIRDAFGDEYVRADGALDRARMRTLVFGDPAAKRALEGILHPLIRAEVRRRIDVSTAPYAVVVVPLLLETGAYRDILDRVLAVDCEESTQVRRVQARSGLAEDEVRRIMASQVSRTERLARADDVLGNDGDITTLRAAVETLHRAYLEAARASA